MARLGKIARVAGVGVALWVVALFIAGFAARGCVRQAVRERLATTLGGRAEVGSISLSLLRGHAELRDVTVVRATGGDLRLRVAQANFDIAPLGFGLFTRHVRRILIRGVTLELSGRAALKVHPRPIATDEFELFDAKMTVVASALLPGVGNVQVMVHHAKAGPVTLATSLSWLFKLRELDASIEVASVTVTLRLRDGKLYAAGSVFGSVPIELPFGLNAAAAGDEVTAVMEFFKNLGKEVLLRKAKDLFKSPFTAPSPPAAPVPSPGMPAAP
ncbi:MAG: hypothetical protein KBG15_24755 [Kofleriaceae bacterium]|nr:hypothetical protein [Kofleriaceae bacterium]